MKSTGVSYLLWLLCFVGLCGIHRFYNGKWVTGLLWLFTGGLFFIGQFVDLFLIPGMVERANYKTQMDFQRVQNPRGSKY
ncbi:MAG: NINE protein [Phycisphaerales bacterium]|nr:NINE protein [Phycisphaerales bacterium]